MVEVVKENIGQGTVLELLLNANCVPYIVSEGNETTRNIGLGFPYLVVDGAPLNVENAIKWITERN